MIEPRGPNEPDILLVTEFKNWAALDHLGSKLDQISAQIEGSVDAAAKSEADRAKIRTVLGSRTNKKLSLSRRLGWWAAQRRPPTDSPQRRRTTASMYRVAGFAGAPRCIRICEGRNESSASWDPSTVSVRPTLRHTA